MFFHDERFDYNLLIVISQEFFMGNVPKYVPKYIPKYMKSVCDNGDGTRPDLIAEGIFKNFDETGGKHSVGFLEYCMTVCEVTF